jgi:hypothetical protein
MLEFLKDPVWQFIGTSIIAIAIALGVFFLQRQRKLLSYEIITENRLLTINEEILGNIKILYNEHPVKNISLLVIKVFNAGNIAIPIIDYENETPISLNLGALTKILSSAIIEVNPKHLPAKIEIKDNQILILPCLLNSTDSITLKLLLSDFKDEINFVSRISGVKNISNIKDSFSIFEFLFRFAQIAFMLFPFFYLDNLAALEKFQNETTLMKVSLIAILTPMCLIYILILLNIIFGNKIKKKLIHLSNILQLTKPLPTSQYPLQSS